MATLQKESINAGIEPDEWYLTRAPRGEEPPPDLAIEVVLTSGGIDKLELYRRFRVREVWSWRNDKICVYHLKDLVYVEADRSLALPGIDICELEQLVAASDKGTDQLAVVRAYRASLRQ